MSWETIATLRIARDEEGTYVGVLDLHDGGAPESLEGFSTLEGLCTRASRMIAASLNDNSEVP